MSKVGPYWEESELALFFNLLRQQQALIDNRQQNTLDFHAIANALKNRTSSMVKALHARHKGYLSLPDANQRAFVTTAQDSQNSSRQVEEVDEEDDDNDYDMDVSDSDDDDIRVPEGTDVNVLNLLSSVANEMKSIEEGATKKRKPRRVDPAPSISPKRKRTPKKRKTSVTHSVISSSPARARIKVTRGKESKRKRRGSKRKGRDESMGTLLANRTPTKRITVKELIEHELENTYVRALCAREEYFNVKPSAWQPLQESFTKCLGSKKFRRFCYYEWFYSVVDRLYFDQNEFVDCLDALGLRSISRLARCEWSRVRAMIGKPRRFSRAFLSEEREKLSAFRNDVRDIQRKVQVNTELVRNRDEVTPILEKGQRVLVNHPKLNEIVCGEVMGVSRMQGRKSANKAVPYRIRYKRKELGSMVVPDTNLMPVTVVELRDTADAAVSNIADAPQFPFAPDDLHLVSTILRYLDRKEALIVHLRDMNNYAEQQIQAQTGEVKPMSSTFRQQYAWVIIQMEQTSRALENALLTLRIRQQGSLALTKYSQHDLFNDDTVSFADVSANKAEKLIGQVIREQTGISDASITKVQPLIKGCMTLVYLIQLCVDRNVPPLAFDQVLHSIQPQAKSNEPIFEDIQQSIAYIKQSLSSNN